MIDGFKVFKYYTALKLHFTSPKFDVFTNRGRMRGSREKFLKRNDCRLFEKVARHVKDDKTCIQYLASNFMYRNPDMIWNDEYSDRNYALYVNRKQSITRVFENDLDVLANSQITYNFDTNSIPDIIGMWLTDKISLETVVILNDFDDIVSKMKTREHISLLLGNDLLLIEKAKKFVKYDSYKVMSYYINFIDEVYRKNGQDISLSAIEV